MPRRGNCWDNPYVESFRASATVVEPGARETEDHAPVEGRLDKNYCCPVKAALPLQVDLTGRVY